MDKSTRVKEEVFLSLRKCNSIIKFQPWLGENKTKQKVGHWKECCGEDAWILQMLCLKYDQGIFGVPIYFSAVKLELSVSFRGFSALPQTSPLHTVHWCPGSAREQMRTSLSHILSPPGPKETELMGMVLAAPPHHYRLHNRAGAGTHTWRGLRVSIRD